MPSEAELAPHSYRDARDQTMMGQRRGDLSRLDGLSSWLKTHQVLLPGIAVLERLVARLRDRVVERVWQALVAGPVQFWGTLVR